MPYIKLHVDHISNLTQWGGGRYTIHVFRAQQYCHINVEGFVYFQLCTFDEAGLPYAWKFHCMPI